MPNSRRFKQLEKRIQIIDQQFLPTIRPAADYTQEEQDNTRAYLLLIHAEIESFLEDIAEDKAKKALNKWVSKRTKSNTLLSLASFTELNDGKLTDKYDLEERLKRTVSNFIARLKNNHGIKQDNIRSILLPIGFESSEIDQTWLLSMDSFGDKRGDIAHSSAQVQQPLDPATMSSTVNQLLNELRIIDEKLRTIN